MESFTTRTTPRVEGRAAFTDTGGKTDGHSDSSDPRYPVEESESESVPRRSHHPRGDNRSASPLGDGTLGILHLHIGEDLDPETPTVWERELSSVENDLELTGENPSGIGISGSPSVF